MVSSDKPVFSYSQSSDNSGLHVKTVSKRNHVLLEYLNELVEHRNVEPLVVLFRHLRHFRRCSVAKAARRSVKRRTRPVLV